MLKLRGKQVIYEPKIQWQHKKAKSEWYSARYLKNLRILPENSAEDLGCKREHCWSYIVSVFENTPKSLVVRGRVQLEHSSYIVKADVKATCLHFNPFKSTGPFETMPHELWLPGKGAKPDHVIQLNCWEVHTHASYKITKTWENFNNRGTKMILLSDKLWLIA